MILSLKCLSNFVVTNLTLVRRICFHFVLFIAMLVSFVTCQQSQNFLVPSPFYFVTFALLFTLSITYKVCSFYWIFDISSMQNADINSQNCHGKQIFENQNLVWAIISLFFVLIEYLHISIIGLSETVH